MFQGDFGFHIWLTFRVLFLALIVIYVLCGLDDLIIDATYYLRSIYRKIFRRGVIKPVTRELLDSVPEKPIAIIVPAWDESNVIARMLLNTASSVLYKNYHVFVGTYPNDEATKLEVEKVREIFPNIQAIVTPLNGPTNKADCLNWVYQGILLFEKERNIQFSAFVFHDAEDVVHPLSLKYYNFLIPRVHFIQVPVFPFEREWHKFTAGCYADEFAETHTKDMRAREVLAASIPSAGVGTALSREALNYLAQHRKNQIFDITSLTEDYMMGLLLKDMPGRKIFLQQAIERTVQRPHPVTGEPHDVKIREQVATREFFPDTFGTAVRQKARWILGISIQGWRAGWSKSLGLNYCLYRDRKAVFTNFLVVLGYVVVLYWAVTGVAGAISPDYATPPLIRSEDPVFFLMYVVGGLFGWRMLNRVYAVKKIYNWPQAFLCIPRFFWGNIINFCATWQGVKRWINAKRTGKMPEWGKTAHAYPTEDQLLNFRRKLGDLLLERRLITTAQLETAVQRQKETGRKLGEILMDMGALWEEDLVHALAHQRNEKAVELDPHGTPLELLGKVPVEMARKYRVFPIEQKENALILATDAQQRDVLKAQMENALGAPVRLQWTSSADIDFAISRAYRRIGRGPEEAQPSLPSDRLGERLVQEGVLDKDDLQSALRKQKRTDQKLGEILVEMKLVKPEDLDRERPS